MSGLTKKIRKAAKEVPIEIRRLLGKNYPAFVTQGKVWPLSGEVPVFMFHTLRSDFFRAQLDYLKTNGYRSLTLKTFMAYLKGEYALEGPSVVLSFDDGDVSWYQVAYPLLKHYGFHAIGFVVPHYIRADANKMSGSRWLSWPEVIEMDQSGVIDIQSHTYAHKLIFTKPVLSGFYHPRFSENGLNLDVPWLEAGGSDTNDLKWGTPIYQSASRMSAHPRLIGGDAIRKACTEWVETQGGAHFFDSQSWEKALQNFYRESAKKYPGDGVFESVEQQGREILHELSQAKAILEEKLNKPIESLCYPWGAGSELAVKLSQEAGYTSNFWVTVKHRQTNKTGDSRYYITRLKDDYIFRLPGAGRRPLLDIFKMKLRRRAETLDIY